MKFFYDVNRESRAAIQRSGAQVPYAFEIGDFETTSTISWALKKCTEEKERFCSEWLRRPLKNCFNFCTKTRCPWDEGTCSAAAHYGHLECLTYAHENGCCWDERTCLHRCL